MTQQKEFPQEAVSKIRGTLGWMIWVGVFTGLLSAYSVYVSLKALFISIRIPVIFGLALNIAGLTAAFFLIMQVNSFGLFSKTRNELELQKAMKYSTLYWLICSIILIASFLNGIYTQIFFR